MIVAVDIQGIGAIRALKERGLLIPDDMKLVSLTGHSIGGMLETTMTSMEIPAHEMGRKAAGMVVEAVETKGRPQDISHLVFDPVLIERESS